MSAPRRAFKRVGWYEPHPILRLLAKHRADADNIDAAQVLKRILGDRCILEVAGEDLATNVNHFTLAQSGPAHHLSNQQKKSGTPDGTLPSNGGRYIRQSRDRGKFRDAVVGLLRPGGVMGSGPKICRVEREARVDYTATLQTESP